jgi:hypothetical protein
MWMAEEWREGDEEVRSRRRFAVILAFSALLHLVVLFAIKLRPSVPSGSGYPVLTVMFQTMAPAPSASLRSRPPAETLVKPPPLPRPVAPAPSPVRETRPEVKLPAQEAQIPSKANSGTNRPAPGRDARASAAVGGFSVLMSIGDGGLITQILWDRLPALTDEQLKRLESILRANTYPESMAGTMVTEVVDVRGLLGLSPIKDSRPLAPPTATDSARP